MKSSVAPLALVALASLPALLMARKEGENCDPKRSLHGACEQGVAEYNLACYERNSYIQCAKPIALGDECTHSRDCDITMQCSDGKCAKAAGMAEACASRYWGCGKAGYCSPSRLSCVPFRLEDESCSQWFECENNLTCSSGVCVKRSKRGEPCSTDQDCIMSTFCNIKEGQCELPRGIGGACEGDLQCGGALECAEEGTCTRRAIPSPSPATDPPTTTLQEEEATTDALDSFLATLPTSNVEEESSEEDKGFWNWKIILGISAGGAVLLLILLILLCCCFRSRKDKAYTEQFAGRSGAFSTFSSEA